MPKFSAQGWSHLSGDHPEIAAVRNDILRLLQKVPEPHRSEWAKRLKSKLNHPHFSVRLEIVLHHFFKERGWKVRIEPDLPGTKNKPDFLVGKDDHRLIVEAKTVLGPESDIQQDSRLMQLANGLSSKLKRTVLVLPMLDLPSSLPNRRIVAEIEDRATKVEPLQEFRVERESTKDSFTH